MPRFYANTDHMHAMARQIQTQSDTLRQQIVQSFSGLVQEDSALASAVASSHVVNDFLYDMTNYLAVLVASREALGKQLDQRAHLIEGTEDRFNRALSWREEQHL